MLCLFIYFVALVFLTACVGSCVGRMVIVVPDGLFLWCGSRVRDRLQTRAQPLISRLCF